MKSKQETKGRYAAKLLFQFKVSSREWQNKRRLCEERIVVFQAGSASDALKLAKRRGRASQHSYKNSEGNRVHFEFVGVLDLLELGVECDPDEVWYEFKERLLPKERKAAIVPAERDLCAIRNERRWMGATKNRQSQHF